MQHLLTFIILLFFYSKSTSLYLLQNVVGAECRRCRMSSVQNKSLQNVVAAECRRCRMSSLQNVVAAKCDKSV